MMRVALAMALLSLFACGPAQESNGSGSAVAAPKGAAAIDALIARMTLDEKLGQLTQLEGAWDAPGGPKIDDKYRAMIGEGKVGSFLSVFGADFTRELQTIAVEKSRLKIPLLFAFDVIHGFRTTFPTPIAEVSSWDPVKVEQGARIAATEATAAGIHWTFAPMVDIARDGRWGRGMEGAGEDPYLGMVMAAARVHGFQGNDLAAPDTLLACAKHFAAYGAVEGGRDYNTAEVSERTLLDVYLPPFRAAVDAGVVTFMSAFNDVGGIPASANHGLMTDVLRTKWGFRGFVVSDWKSVGQLVDHGVAADDAEAARLGLTAGVDMEMVSKTYIEHLAAEVKAGRVSMAVVDQSVRRVLEAKQRLGLFDDPFRYSDPQRERDRILTPEHRAAAREMAREAMVLLGNRGNVLPLSRDLRSIAVIGPLADSKQVPLGPWSVPGRAADVVSVLEGLTQALPKTRVLHAAGVGIEPAATDPSTIAQAAALARGADAVLLVLGEPDTLSGEAKSRSDIRLPGRQDELARAVIAANPHTAVILMNGRPLAIPELAATAPALLETWFLGVEAGNAIADVVLGDYNPSGKLPVTFPNASGQEPLYYNQKTTGRPADDKVVWSSKYIDVPIPPLYPFGHGLSYTYFHYSDLSVTPEKPTTTGTLVIEFSVENMGDRAGTEIAQLYAHDRVTSVARPALQLRGFARVELAAHQKRRVRIEMPLAMLAFHGLDMKLAVEPGALEILIGSSSADIRLRADTVVAGPRAVLESDHAIYSKTTIR